MSSTQSLPTIESVDDFDSSNNESLYSSELDTTTRFYGRLGYGSLEQYTTFLIAYYLKKYYLWVFLALGVPGNIFAIATALRLKPMTSWSLYILVLAVVDGSAIISKLLYIELQGYGLVWLCGLLMFFSEFTSIYANFILVAMTVERLIAITFPLKAREFCTIKKASIILAISGFVAIGINSHTVMSADVYYSIYRQSWTCRINKDKWEFDFFYTQVWPWIDVTVFLLIPTVVLLLCNGMIILAIRRSHALQNQMANNKMQENVKQQRQITTMLLTVSTMFVILNLPYSYFSLDGKLRDSTNDTEKQHVTKLMGKQIAHFMADANHVINFYMYCISGRKFRKTFIDNVIKCKPQERNPSIYTTNASRVTQLPN